MLSNARLQTIVWTSRMEEARTFYQNVLGLHLRHTSDGALVFDVGGSDLRVAPVPSTAPSEHTVMGFGVEDLDACIHGLSARGVKFLRFAGFPQDILGAVVTPDGSVKLIATFLARMVIPRSRSRGLESSSVSCATCESRKLPLWRSRASTSVVLP